MQIYASDKTSPRSFPWLWYIRLVALVVTLIVVGITVWNTASFSSAGCDAPARLLYNLAVVCPYPYSSVEYRLTLVLGRPLLHRSHLLHPRLGAIPHHQAYSVVHGGSAGPRYPRLHLLDLRCRHLLLQLHRLMQRLRHPRWICVLRWPVLHLF